MGEGDREVERIMMINTIPQVKFQLHVSHAFLERLCGAAAAALSIGKSLPLQTPQILLQSPINSRMSHHLAHRSLRDCMIQSNQEFVRCYCS